MIFGPSIKDVYANHADEVCSYTVNFVAEADQVRKSVPSGLSPAGLPTGLSIVGKTYDDVSVFRVAAAHEECLPWFTEPGPRPRL